MQSLPARSLLRRPCFLTRSLWANHTYDSPEKPYYITTPIFYPNAAPHIGHLHSLVVADIYARYSKLVNPSRRVHLVTGTDEHGLKIQNAAKAKGMDPLAFCDELSEQFRNLTQKANVSCTRFTRTTERQHCDAVTHLWKELYSMGLIYKGRHAGWYSVSDETFYPSTQVEQKEKDGEEYYVSTTSGSRVEWQEEENYMFRLSGFRTQLYDYYVTRPDAIYPPQHQVDIMKSLSDLEDLSVSRKRSRLTWGIPVPNDPEHTIYVWIDALTTYLSSVGYPFPPSTVEGVPRGAAQGWPPNVQVIGKDILRFHAVYLPAMLQVLNLPQPRHLLAHSHWTVDRAKMSKSVGNVADPIQAIDEFGIDLVRYYLARVGGRFKDDVDWSQAQLQKHSKEIISALGNLLMRATSTKIRRKVAKVKRPRATDAPDDLPFGHLKRCLLKLSPTYRTLMEGFRVADAVDEVVNVLDAANILMNQVAPWAKETSGQDAAYAQMLVFEALRECGILLQPIMPEKATLLLDALDVPATERTLEDAAFGKREVGDVQSGVRLFDVNLAKVKE